MRTPLVAKFYRGGRWSDAAIEEEHAFALELAEAELPVVAPLRFAKCPRCCILNDFRFALYPRQGGRAPELESADNLAWMGRLLARLHGVAVARHVPRARHARSRNADRIAGHARVLASPLLPRDVARSLRARHRNTRWPDRRALRRGRRGAQSAPARRLPRRQCVVDRCRSAFRRSRRCAHGTGRAGSVDARADATRASTCCSKATPSSATSTGANWP